VEEDAMTYRVAVNGFGRIGRDYLRCVLERGLFDDGVDVVAVNDVWDAATLTHLLRYDSAFGRLNHEVETVDGGIVVNGRHIDLSRLSDFCDCGKPGRRGDVT